MDPLHMNRSMWILRQKNLNSSSTFEREYLRSMSSRVRIVKYRLRCVVCALTLEVKRAMFEWQ